MTIELDQHLTQKQRKQNIFISTKVGLPLYYVILYCTGTCVLRSNICKVIFCEWLCVNGAMWPHTRRQHLMTLNGIKKTTCIDKQMLLAIRFISQGHLCGNWGVQLGLNVELQKVNIWATVNIRMTLEMWPVNKMWCRIPPDISDTFRYIQ